MSKLNNFVIITIFVYVCVVTRTSALKCYTCADDVSCQRTTQYNVTKDCTDECVTIFSEFVPIKKSCVSDLTDNERKQCDDASNSLCYKCTNDYCNNLGRIDHKCITCTTKNENNDCLQDPTKIAGTRCPAPTADDAYCFVNSVGNSTERGCVTTAREQESCRNSDLNCSICHVNSTYSCNTYPFPTSRTRCIHCSGTNCNAVTSASLYCLNADDKCVAINNFGNQSQSCARDISLNNKHFCENHPFSCTTCNYSDCNNALPKSPDNYNECFSCEGISCQRSTQYNQTTDCEKTDECVTLFENYVPIKKTCYANLSPDEKIKCDKTTDPLCYKCTGNRCNNLGRIDHKCLSCSSTNDQNCLQNPKSVTATRCAAPISDDAYCFVKSIRDTVTRGCLNTPQEISTCVYNPQQCLFCAVQSNSSCNTFEFPTGRRRCHTNRGANSNALSTSPSKYCQFSGDSCMILKSNGTLSQFCSMEMNSTEIQICDSHRECCNTCRSNNCNTQIPVSLCGVPARSMSDNVYSSVFLTVFLSSLLGFFEL